MTKRVNAVFMVALICLCGLGASLEFAAPAGGSSISQTQEEGLVAWYRFDEGLGSTLGIALIKGGK